MNTIKEKETPPILSRLSVLTSQSGAYGAEEGEAEIEIECDEETSSFDSKIDRQSDEFIAHRLKVLSDALESDPLRKLRKILMLKAFYKWSSIFPIYQKCDELGKQLQERLNTLGTVRECYIRDVISIKFHLDNLSEATVKATIEHGKSKANQLSNENDDDLHTESLPSVDLRAMIKKCKDAPNQSSTQLRETLIKAGLQNPNTDRMLNPWEKGSAFKKIMKAEKGLKYKVPVGGGNVVHLHAPSKHTLFVRYCKDCIGFMGLVYKWNQEVEGALNMWGERENKDFESLRQARVKETIKTLTENLFKEEVENRKKQTRIDQLESANKWFQDWEYGKEAHKVVEAIQERNKEITNAANMESAECETKILNVTQKCSDELRLISEKNEDLSQSLIAAKKQISLDKRRIHELEHQIIEKDEEKAIKAMEMSSLFEKVEKLNADIRQHQLRYDSHMSMITDLTNALDLKEKELQTYKTDSERQINDYKTTIDAMTTDYDMKEREVDNLRDELRASKDETKATRAEVNMWEVKLGDTIKQHAEYTAMVEKTMTPIQPKEKYTLKMVAQKVTYILGVNRAQRKEEAKKKNLRKKRIQDQIKNEKELKAIEKAVEEVNYLRMRGKSKRKRRSNTEEASSCDVAGLDSKEARARALALNGVSKELTYSVDALGGDTGAKGARCSLLDATENSLNSEDFGFDLDRMEEDEVYELMDMAQIEIDQLRLERLQARSEIKELKKTISLHKVSSQIQRSFAVKLEKALFSLRCHLHVVHSGHQKFYSNFVNHNIPMFTRINEYVNRSTRVGANHEVGSDEDNGLVDYVFVPQIRPYEVFRRHAQEVSSVYGSWSDARPLRVFCFQDAISKYVSRHPVKPIITTTKTLVRVALSEDMQDPPTSDSSEVAKNDTNTIDCGDENVVKSASQEEMGLVDVKNSVSPGGSGSADAGDGTTKVIVTKSIKIPPIDYKKMTKDLLLEENAIVDSYCSYVKDEIDGFVNGNLALISSHVELQKYVSLFASQSAIWSENEAGLKRKIHELDVQKDADDLTIAQLRAHVETLEKTVESAAELETVHKSGSKHKHRKTRRMSHHHRRGSRSHSRAASRNGRRSSKIRQNSTLSVDSEVIEEEEEETIKSPSEAMASIKSKSESLKKKPPPIVVEPLINIDDLPPVENHDYMMQAAGSIDLNLAAASLRASISNKRKSVDILSTDPLLGEETVDNFYDSRSPNSAMIAQKRQFERNADSSPKKSPSKGKYKDIVMDESMLDSQSPAKKKNSVSNIPQASSSDTNANPAKSSSPRSPDSRMIPMENNTIQSLSVQPPVADNERGSCDVSMSEYSSSESGSSSYSSGYALVKAKRAQLEASASRHSIFSANNRRYLLRHSALKSLRAKVKFAKCAIDDSSEHASKVELESAFAPLVHYVPSKADDQSLDSESSEDVSDLDEDSIFIDDDTISLVGTPPKVYRNWKIVLLRAFCVVNERVDEKIDAYTKHQHDLELGKLMEHITDLEDSLTVAKELQEQTDLHVESLKGDIEVWKKKNERLQNALKELQQELENNIEENAVAHAENHTLRTAVEDSYRKTKSEIAKVMKENERKRKEAEDEVIRRRRQKSTQISCVTCEFKYGASSSYLRKKQRNRDDNYSNDENDEGVATVEDGDYDNGYNKSNVPVCISVGGPIPDEGIFDQHVIDTPSAMSPTATTNAIYNPQYNQHGDLLLTTRPRKINGVNSVESIEDGPLDQIEDVINFGGSDANMPYMAKYSDVEPSFAVAGANIYTAVPRPQSAAAAMSKRYETNRQNPMFFNNGMMGSSSEKDIHAKPTKTKGLLTGTMIPATLPTPKEHLSKFTRIKNMPSGGGVSTNIENACEDSNQYVHVENRPTSAKYQTLNSDSRPLSALMKPVYKVTNTNKNDRPQSANVSSRPSTSALRNLDQANPPNVRILSASLNAKDNKFSREAIKDTTINPITTVATVGGASASVSTQSRPGTASGLKKRLEERKDTLVGASLIQENIIASMGLHANMGYTVLKDKKHKNKFSGHRNTLGQYQTRQQSMNSNTDQQPPVLEIDVPIVNIGGEGVS